jgi:homoserine kinase type II
MQTDELHRVLAHYDLGELKTARRVERGFVNENWDLTTSRGRYFLKRRHPDLCDPGVIHAQHALVEHLRRKGFPAPAILPTVGGATLLALDGECYEIHEYVAGAPYDDDRPAHFCQAASTLGHYHACVQGFAPRALHDLDELYTPAVLNANLDNLVAAWEPGSITQQLAAHADDLAARYASHGDLPHLVIHGDYYAGNLLFEDDRVVAVVDYDKVRWQPRVVELGEALIYFASPRPGLGHLEHLVYGGFLHWEPFVHFLRHYARVVTLDGDEIRALPDYVRCIWLSVSLRCLLQREPRPVDTLAALREVLALGDWARDNARQMSEYARQMVEYAQRANRPPDGHHQTQ